MAVLQRRTKHPEWGEKQPEKEEGNDQHESGGRERSDRRVANDHGRDDPECKRDHGIRDDTC
jgi:hypothetical protein